MEIQQRVQLIDTLLEEARQKSTTLTQALHAKERAEQEKETPHSAPGSEGEELKYEQELWQQAEIGLNEVRTRFDAIEQLERQRGVS